MPSWFRSAVMWLLVAALPAQSWAAATMVNCGPSHHQMVIESTVAQDAVPHTHTSDHDAMESHSGHSHEHDVATGVSVADVQGSEPSDSDHYLQKLGKFKCSACASCCVGLALPPALSSVASVSSDTLVAGMPQAIAVFLTDGLERPPRTILA